MNLNDSIEKKNVFSSDFSEIQLCTTSDKLLKT